MDAPRHICIHTRESMECLAVAHNMRIIDVSYDSEPSQMFRSFLYTKDIPFWEQKMAMIHELMGEDEIQEMKDMTKQANENENGDHAVFSLVRA